MSKDKVWKFGSEYEEVSNIIGRVRSKEKEVEGIMKIIKDFFENEVKWHFRKEEEGLIPILQEVIKEERSVIDKTLASHQEFRQMYKQFLHSMDSFEKLLKLIDRMMVFLETHALWEDSTLFPIANKLLNKDQMNNVILRIMEIEREQRSSG